MKKSFYKYLTLSLIIVSVASCEDILNLEPAQSLSNETALDNDEGVKQALIGAYDNMSQTSLLGGELMRNAELYGADNEILWVGTYTAPREIFNRDILNTNADVLDLWTDAYEVINTCNNVINAIDVVLAADQNRVRGEALALRAWAHFELTRMFGQQYEAGIDNTQLAVPLILIPTLAFGDNVDVTRNTVEECYNQVIADLTEAESLLPEKNDVFINKYTAAALLARVYLQKADYAAARDAADRVIASGDYELNATYAECFAQDDPTDEDIFSAENSELDNSNVMVTYFAINDFGGRADIEIEDSHLALYDDLDARKAMFFVDGDATFTSKYNNEFGNLSIIRLAEMYLIRAECNSRLGTAVGAEPVDDYNMVHTRAGLPAEGAVALDDILLERRLELALEGFKVHDIKRLKGTISVMNYNDPKMIYPIPVSEIEINPLLEQNPGY
ncbi:MAG TPA: RagB/SusD family nutrient uptake outer membrane protein [Chitinophagales bacterium]|nr:RagB/SusD family nutrient uptake outer membrane protein [Chitinophagales bacterium]HRG84622.1 RagB/SusD family nutrient uptake outer membrane protein [Chitinophagales bacterium]HRH53840.1 RagB/SusD family nutrient uptake outer membrane protein [Chitinophagales bacterium]